MTITIEEQLAKTQTAFQKHVAECSNSFYARKYAEKCKENEELKKRIAELKRQVDPLWA